MALKCLQNDLPIWPRDNKKIGSKTLDIEGSSVAGTRLAALKIRRARPKACAWRTESDTLTNLLIFLFLVLSFLTFLFLWIYQGYTYRIILRNPKEGALRPRHRGRVQRFPWILEPQDFSRFSDVFPRQTHVKPRLRYKIATAKKSKNSEDASKRFPRCLQ